MRKLYKSKENKVLAGVIGGLGEYFDVDPVVLRIFWVLLVALTGLVPGIIVYLFACLIVPSK